MTTAIREGITMEIDLGIQYESAAVRAAALLRHYHRQYGHVTVRRRADGTRYVALETRRRGIQLDLGSDLLQDSRNRSDRRSESSSENQHVNGEE